MVITRTPFRISFFGGGTDYPVWYVRNGGIVISTTINKYCYVVTRHLPPLFDYKYRIRYTKREETKTVSQIKHPSVRGCLRFLNVKYGIEMIHTSDLPANSGLGSSSAFTVGFLNSLYTLKNKKVSKKQLAVEAIYIEQKKIKENVGSQDQVAASYGGFNAIKFRQNGQISISPIKISSDRLDQLQKHIALFYTGVQRNASLIASTQIKNIPKNTNKLRSIMDIANRALKILPDNNQSLDELGKLLNDSWLIKRSLAFNISNPFIDEIYKEGISVGALGGKLLGAGSGGFMIFFIKPKLQNKIKGRLNKLLYIPFKFEDEGTKVIFHINNFI